MSTLSVLSVHDPNSAEYFFRLVSFSLATFTLGFWAGITTWKIRGGYWRHTDYEHLLSSASIIVFMLGYMILQAEAVHIEPNTKLQIGIYAFPIGVILVIIWQVKMVNDILELHGRRNGKGKKKVTAEHSL